MRKIKEEKAVQTYSTWTPSFKWFIFGEMKLGGFILTPVITTDTYASAEIKGRFISPSVQSRLLVEKIGTWWITAVLKCIAWLDGGGNIKSSAIC